MMGGGGGVGGGRTVKVQFFKLVIDIFFRLKRRVQVQSTPDQISTIKITFHRRHTDSSRIVSQPVAETPKRPLDRNTSLNLDSI